jgi:hypothetical protein
MKKYLVVTEIEDNGTYTTAHYDILPSPILGKPCYDVTDALNEYSQTGRTDTFLKTYGNCLLYDPNTNNIIKRRYDELLDGHIDDVFEWWDIDLFSRVNASIASYQAGN